MKTRANKLGNEQTTQQRPATVSPSMAESDSASPEERTTLEMTSDDTQHLKVELLSSLRNELAEILSSELQSMLGDY